MSKGSYFLSLQSNGCLSSLCLMDRPLLQHTVTVSGLCLCPTKWSPWKLRLSKASVHFSSVQSLSRVQLCNPMNRSTQGLPVHHQVPEYTQTHDIQSVMPSSHLILFCPLLLLPPIPPSIRVFSNESTLRMGWPEYWSFSFSIIPSKEIPELISFRM